jgi:hypothetical protein
MIVGQSTDSLRCNQFLLTLEGWVDPFRGVRCLPL